MSKFQSYNTPLLVSYGSDTSGDDLYFVKLRVDVYDDEIIIGAVDGPDIWRSKHLKEEK